MINLVNVRKSFEVLKDINLQIHEKEIYGIIGQSGAGKSTLLRCINGLETYDSGTITVDGTAVDVNDKKQLRQLRKDMGMIFQNFNLLSRLDVYDNVALPLRFWNENPNTEEKNEDPYQKVSMTEKEEDRLKKIKEQEPDLILLDGDILNEDSENADVPCALIRKLKEKGMSSDEILEIIEYIETHDPKETNE